MNEVKKIARSTIIYLFGSVAARLVSFFLLPLYTKYILPADYGTYDLNVTYVTLISSIAFLDIWCGILRFMFDKKDMKHKYKTIYTGLIIFIGSSIFYLISFVVFARINNMRYMLYVLIFGFMMCIQSLYSYVARGLGYNVSFAVSGIISTIVNASINVVLILIFKMDYKCLYISYIIGTVVQCLILEYKVKLFSNFSRKYIDLEQLKQMVRFSLPLCVNSLAYWILTGYNKVVIANQLSVTQNGYFAIATKFSVALTLISTCISMAWQELAFSKSDLSEETSKFYSNATNVYFKLLFCASLALLPVVSIVFPFLVNKSYSQARIIIPIYIFATVLSIFSDFLASIIGAYKKNKSIFIATISACITNVVVISLLIGRLGVLAACISIFCGYAVNCAVRIFMIKNYIQFKFDIKILLYMVPLSVVFTLAYNKHNIIYDVITLLGAMCVTLFLFRKDITHIFHKFKM
jgi:O-antigen/teichoic acid export membrane protein